MTTIGSICIAGYHFGLQNDTNLQLVFETGFEDLFTSVGPHIDRQLIFKQGFIDFWVPTFFFIKRNEFALFNEGIYTPTINEDILERVSKIPQDFELKSFVLEGVKLDIFNSYRKFLNIDQKNNADSQTFIETIKPCFVFYRSLPDYSKYTRRLKK